MTAIRKVAVLGSGVMGGGIAAHVANAGVEVVLLDIVPKGATNRNQVAEGAIQRLLKANPAAFMHPRNARLVTPGNLEDHLPLLADCDWIVEVVLEDLAVKRATYEKVERHRKEGSIVSSNTSTIPLRDLVEGMPERFQRDFCITHFFNPPRYMRLLEIVRGAKTRADAIETLEAFCDVRLGKGVVHAKDTPGFIANRIGGMWMQAAVGAAMDLGLAVEEADAIMGRPFGFPKTGVFALLDLVGIDLMPHVASSMRRTLPADDLYIRNLREPELVKRMIADGLTGRKGKGGFFRMQKGAGGERTLEAIDLKTGQYRKTEEPQLESIREGKRNLGALLAHPDRGGEFARRVMALTLAYSAMLVPEISDDIVGVDEAMRLGYAWKWGPFELIDKIGADAVIAALERAKIPVPPLLARAKGRSFYRVNEGALEYLAVDGSYKKVERRPGVLLLADIKRKSRPVARNGSASLWDIGDGVLCLEFHTKMNALDGDVMDLLQKSLETVKRTAKALVIYNEGSNFSVGANVGLALFGANLALWPMIEELETKGQMVLKAVKYASVPVVAAPAGMALGGGCEIVLHSAAVQAHAESYIGLVETGVGLVPGWGGCKELLYRHALNPKRPQGPMPPVVASFETIGLAKVSKSAAEAQDYLLLRPSDGITMNRDRLLADAKARALALAKDYQPPKPQPISLPGPTGAAALGLALDDFHHQGKATDYDMVVSGKLARVLTGGDADMLDETTEDKLLALEREAFLSLIREPRTLARIEHMLETGKPLRN
jgi:3-hydroxyacyl-CoA dehydrogenase